MTHEEFVAALGGDGIARQAANAITREYEDLIRHLGSQVALLITMTREDLLDIRNVGPLSVSRVERFLIQQGHSLRTHSKEIR